MKIVGLTGTIGSGKETVKELIEKLSKLKFSSISLSTIVKEEARKMGKEINRKNLQDVGNMLRRKYGREILVKLSLKRLSGENLIIDGIRNLGEVKYLRKKFGRNFILIGVDAPPKIRFKRIVKRAKKDDPKTWDEFLEMNKRDLGINEPPYGQQVKKCLERCDIKIINDGSKKELREKVKKILNSEYFSSSF